MKHTNPQMKSLILWSLLTIAMISCNKNNDYQQPLDPGPVPPKSQSTFVKASGDLTEALATFRHLSGDSLNTKPDANPFGRREINWDAVPANLTNNTGFPFDFFNSTDPAASNARKRGLVLQGQNKFQVDSSSFTSVNVAYADEFTAFSPKRIFAPIGSNVTEIRFRLPGTDIEAGVKTFGAIFSDVDLDESTSIEYFDGDESLGVFFAPVRKSNGGFSFVGAFFPVNNITRVRITAGNGALGAGANDITAGGSKDLVVMDDFIYSEPKTLVHK